MAGVLHSWIYEQKNRQREVELFLLFLQKSLSVMTNEKIKVVDYFIREIEQDSLFEENEMFLNTFIEILKRLLQHPLKVTLKSPVIVEIVKFILIIFNQRALKDSQKIPLLLREHKKN